MPIYAYKCDSCGFAKDVLQKISDQPLVQCPSCEAQAFKKQLTAAGFQLRGSGWYATDFKDSGKKAPATDDSKSATESSAKSEPVTTTKSDTAAPASAPAAKKTETTPSTGSGN